MTDHQNSPLTENHTTAEQSLRIAQKTVYSIDDGETPCRMKAVFPVTKDLGGILMLGAQGLFCASSDVLGFDGCLVADGDVVVVDGDDLVFCRYERFVQMAGCAV